MKKLAMVVGFSILLVGCSGDKDTATSSPEETMYKKSCAACHGGNLEGKVGGPLDKIGSKMSKEEILKLILEGKGGMAGGFLKGEDADKVATWLAAKK